MSDTKLSLNNILGEDGVQNAFNNLMSLWVLPENLILDRAQAILQPDKQE
jgi:hypothetical protein